MTASDEPRRVLYVNHEVECGGAELSLLELIEGLDRDQFEPHLVSSMAGPLTDRAQALDAEVHFVPMLFPRGLRKAFGIGGAALKLRRLIGRLGVQLVHTNSLIAGYCGIFAAKLCEVPSIWHVRDMSYPPAGKKVCTQATRVIANSQATADSLDFPAKARDRLHVVYNGVSPTFFTESRSHDEARQDVRAELHLRADEKLVGTFARLDPWKGHAELLDAAKMVLRKAPDTTFVIVGETLFQSSRHRHQDHRQNLEQQARDLGIWGKVRFLGQRDDIPRLMAAMEAVVQPSSEPEPFGRVLAEGQALGIPVIGSDLGGIPEVITDGASGLLFPAGDAAALADRIGTLLDDAELAAKLSAGGQTSARQRFTRAAHAETVQAIYSGLPTTNVKSRES